MTTASTLHGQHFTTGQGLELHLNEGQLASVTPTSVAPTDILAPAFFDLQINGGHGIGYTSAELTVDGVRQVVECCATHGIAEQCPTVVTNSFAVMHHSFSVLRQACAADRALAAALPCFHLEGPYIADGDGPRGAHPRAHVRPPDEVEFQRLQEAAGGRIGLITLAPELPGALAFIERRVREGLVISLGHSAAEPATIRDAVRAGATLSTHLGNGCHRQLPRHENLLWEQLAADELSASLITDGFHLPWTLVRCFVRMKGVERIILTADASEKAGLPPGRYGQWAQTVDVTPEGKIVLVGQGVLAGSWAFTDLCVSRLVASGCATLAEALTMATANPRRLLRQPPRTLEAGQPANVLVLERTPTGGVRLVRSLIRGQWRAGPAPAAAD